VYYSLETDKIDAGVQGSIFFDPNTLSDDGTVAVPALIYLTNVKLQTYTLSFDGYYRL
jgi:hypothetical protein